MSDVQAIKDKLDIVQLIGESVPLKKAGRNFKGLCPFHQEKTPSFMVSPDRQSYHCFGCAAGGDLFEFVMQRERVDFPEALRMLATRAGVELQGFDAAKHKGKQRLFDATAQAAAYFQAALRHAAGKPAAAYLEQRGVTPATSKAFGIGYAPDDYDALVGALRKKGFKDQELIDAGLALAGRRGPYARFRGRLMIPLADSSGAIRGFTGRVIPGSGSEQGSETVPAKAGGDALAKYVNTPETAIYHKGSIVFALHQAKQAMIEADAAVLVEGQMDVISAHQAGTANVVATSGTAMTDEQLRQIARFTKTLVLALDRDEAGAKALLRIVELVGDPSRRADEIELKVADLGSAKDPDELISHDPAAWRQAVTDAQPVIDYVLGTALAKTSRPYDRAAINAVLGVVLPVLRFRPALDQDYYVEQLAGTLGLEKVTIKDRLARLTAPDQGRDRSGTGDRVATEQPEAAEVRKTPEDLVSERMIGLAMTTPALQPKLNELDRRIFSERYREAAELLKNDYNKVTLRDARRRVLDVCALAAAEYEPMSEPERAAEFDRLYRRLKQLWVKQHQPKLLAAIKRAEATNDRNRRNRLMEEYTTLTKRIAHG